MNELDFKRLTERLVVVGDHLLWIGGFGSGGYGHLNVGGKLTSAHRAAYEHWVGPIAGSRRVVHLCPLRSCCAPDHLTEVSRDESLRRARGRLAEFSRAAPKSTQTPERPAVNDVFPVLRFLDAAPDATKNQVVKHLVSSVEEMGETRAKSVIGYAVELGLVSAQRTGPGRTDPVRHTLTDSGSELLGKPATG